MAVRRVYESCLVPSAIDKVWESLSPFDLAFLDGLHSMVVNEGKAGEVGSECTATYTDGNYETFKLTCHDRNNFEIGYEVVESKQALVASNVRHTIKLRPVTHTNHTFLEFTADYSVDIPLKDYVAAKFEKRVFFGSLKRYIATHDDTAEWTCDTCTFLNAPKTIHCGVCGHEKKLPDSKYYSILVPVKYSNHINDRSFVTDTFSVAGHTWQLVVFPRGDNCDYLSLFLKILDLPEGQNASFFCNFQLRLIRPQQKGVAEQRKTSEPCSSFHNFCCNDDRGFKEVLPLEKIVWYLDANEEIVVQVGVAPLPLPDSK